MPENRVVVYSNGIADFQRCFEVAADNVQSISIPVRQDHLADVLASFNVYGNIKLETPPTFRPSNELAGNLTINPSRVLEELATNLSGARVRIERPNGTVEGKLLGVQQEEEGTSGEPIKPYWIIVQTTDGLRRCPLREIQALQFLDADVQNEIDKALQRNYQQIKPNSTFVELELSACGEKSEAIVQYTIPAAAWKISYRLRIWEDRTTELQGYAIVDNNTDEDWTDFRICVVTGEPITFSTDLAESKSPFRKHVNLVSESALGNVEVEAPDIVFAESLAGAGTDLEGVDAMLMESAPRGRMRARMAKSKMRSSAETTTSAIQEVGDFNIFESGSLVSIPSKRSTAIPMFQVEISDTKPVLHYKHENHPDRPYRAVDFTNRTDFSLGRGVCTVFEEGTYAGNCIIPTLKSGENRLLPHALETGVSLKRDPKRQRNKIIALRLAEGFCYTSTRQRRETHYHIRSSREEEYELVLDHTHILNEPDIEAVLLHDGTETSLDIVSRLTDGVRYAITISPKFEAIIKVVEQRIDQASVELISISDRHENLKVGWIEQNLVSTNGPLALNDGIQNCLQINQELETKRQEISEAVVETERLAGRQERVRQNIKTGGQDELTTRWRVELDETEKTIRTIEEEQIPALRSEEKSLKSNLRDALKSLSAEWAE